MVTRITQSAISASALRGLQASLGRSQDLQNQLSSGRRVSRPADDPSAAAAAMKLRGQRRADEQYLRNADDATGRLTQADSALTGISAQLRRARELVVQAGNPSIPASARLAIQAELGSIRDSVVDQFNTRWLDRPVFGGSAASPVAIDKASGAYLGNDATLEVRISRDATVRTDVKGTDVGADTIPDLLATIAGNVVTDPTTTATDLAALDGEITKVLEGLGDVGARAARIDTTRANVDSERLDFTARISENEDVDLPEAIMKLQSQQIAYQSALGAAGKILQVSLMDYIR